MTLVTQAVIFAAQAHDGAARKGSEIPYIVHPMEVVAIASTMTDDPQVLAAAALHDVMEDCGVTFETLSERFGVRVARLVCEESQRVCGDPCLTWNARKLGAVRRICGGCRAVRQIEQHARHQPGFCPKRRGRVPAVSSVRQAPPCVVLPQLRGGAQGRAGRNRRMARAVRAGGAGVQRRGEPCAGRGGAAARRRTRGMSEFPNKNRETA